MRVIEPGKRYEVHTAQGVPVFDVIFCGMDANGFVDGITNEELVEVLIQRMEYLVTRKPSTENMNTLLHLKQAMSWMHVRNDNKLKKRKGNDSSGIGLHVQAESGQVRQ
jgi:hypothetical protein